MVASRASTTTCTHTHTKTLDAVPNKQRASVDWWILCKWKSLMAVNLDVKCVCETLSYTLPDVKQFNNIDTLSFTQFSSHRSVCVCVSLCVGTSRIVRHSRTPRHSRRVASSNGRKCIQQQYQLLTMISHSDVVTSTYQSEWISVHFAPRILTHHVQLLHTHRTCPFKFHWKFNLIVGRWWLFEHIKCVFGTPRRFHFDI